MELVTYCTVTDWTGSKLDCSRQDWAVAQKTGLKQTNALSMRIAQRLGSTSDSVLEQ